MNFIFQLEFHNPNWLSIFHHISCRLFSYRTCKNQVISYSIEPLLFEVVLANDWQMISLVYSNLQKLIEKLETWKLRAPCWTCCSNLYGNSFFFRSDKSWNLEDGCARGVGRWLWCVVQNVTRQTRDNKPTIWWFHQTLPCASCWASPSPHRSHSSKNWSAWGVDFMWQRSKPSTTVDWNLEVKSSPRRT